MENATYTVTTDDGYKFSIFEDDDPGNPRSDDESLGRIYCLHPRYNIGDKHDFKAHELKEYVRSNEIAVCMPVYLYDHSVQLISTSSFVGRAPHAEWDSCLVGYTFVTKEAIRKEYGVKYVTAKVKERARKALEAEFDRYAKYFAGEVYGFVLEKDGDEIESVWGFYGDNPLENGMAEYLPDSVVNKLHEDFGIAEAV